MEKYKEFLDNLTKYLQKYFEQQKPFIFCKEGCSICCETGHFPVTNVEFEYLMEGFDKLSDEHKLIVIDNYDKAKEQREKDAEKGYYSCPFLINNKCSVYENRAIICRTYGLLQTSYDDEGKEKFYIPCCASMGLNYSNVYDTQKSIISSEMYAKSGITEEPLSYNIGLKYLLKSELAQSVEFGESKPLIEKMSKLFE